MISPQYTFPTGATVLEMARERLATLEETSTLAQIMPLTTEVGNSIQWDIRDDIGGLLPYSGPNDPFPNVNPAGMTRYFMAPSYHAAEMVLDGTRIVSGAQVGTLGEPIDVTAELDDFMLQLQIRALQTRDKARAQLLTSGVVTSTDKDGNVIDAGRWAGWGSQYTELAGGDRWNIALSAKPIRDIRNWATLFKGSGHTLGGGMLIANSTTWGNAFNADDTINRYKDKFGGTIVDLNQWNDRFNTSGGAIGQAGALPMIVGEDGGYKTEAGVFVEYIPDGYVIAAARNPVMGVVVGNYVSTSNVQLMGQAGIYANNGQKKDSPYLPFAEVSMNGGPKINYSRQVRIFKVY